jgi:hypothetical protein
MEDYKIIEILKKAQENSEYVSRNFDKLREKYEGKVFAVKDQKVILDAEKIEDLLRGLEERGEDMAFLLIESIPPKNLSFIL